MDKGWARARRHSAPAARLQRGLQCIETMPALRQEVYALLSEVLAQWPDGEGPVSPEGNRARMAQWQILLLGTLRSGSWA